MRRRCSARTPNPSPGTSRRPDGAGFSRSHHSCTTRRYRSRWKEEKAELTPATTAGWRRSRPMAPRLGLSGSALSSGSAGVRPVPPLPARGAHAASADSGKSAS
ncbi:uncharacterized protein LOC144377359 [Ictidomys tridecemlineatus]